MGRVHYVKISECMTTPDSSNRIHELTVTVLFSLPIITHVVHAGLLVASCHL